MRAWTLVKARLLEDGILNVEDGNAKHAYSDYLTLKFLE